MTLFAAGLPSQTLSARRYLYQYGTDIVGVMRTWDSRTNAPERYQHPRARLDIAKHRSGMHTRAITLRDLPWSDEQAWRDLAERSVEPNPFYEADFLVPASRHLRNGKTAVLVVAEEAGRFHACLPVRSISLPMIISPVITSWQHLYGYLGTPLVAPERAVEALSCILTTLRRRSLWPRTVVFELFGDDGPAASYLRRAADDLGLTVHVHAAGERGVFRCQDDKAGVPQPRQGRGRQLRQLRSDLGEPDVVDRAGCRDGSTDFLAMEASGWKGKAGTALACRAGDAAFYRDVTARFATSGRLRMYSLEAGGMKLAMETDFCADGVLFSWKMSYDERFARYGPGAQLQFRVFNLARQEGLRSVDSCADVGNDHLLRLFPDRCRIATLIIGGNGRMEDQLLTLAVLVVKMSGKLRGLSPRTFRYKLVGASRVIEKAFHR
jgi:CelD/BcsL family acetyltransferase involved in cellulose biosynthesis